MSATPARTKAKRRPEKPPAVSEYAVTVLSERLNRMLSHLEGVKQGETTEPVHQMRVWSRRTRAALDIFQACFPGKEYAVIEREVKKVTGALGEARDLDVMISTLRERMEGLPEEQRPGVDAFVGTLKAQRKAKQRPVEKITTQLEHHDLAARFAALAERVQAEAQDTPSAPERKTHG